MKALLSNKDVLALCACTYVRVGYSSVDVVQTGLGRVVRRPGLLPACVALSD